MSAILWFNESCNWRFEIPWTTFWDAVIHVIEIFRFSESCFRKPKFGGSKLFWYATLQRGKLEHPRSVDHAPFWSQESGHPFCGQILSQNLRSYGTQWMSESMNPFFISKLYHRICGVLGALNKSIDESMYSPQTWIHGFTQSLHPLFTQIV